MVAVYVPPAAAAGTETDRVGFQEAELTELPVVTLKPVSGPVSPTAADAVGWPGVKVPVPAVAGAGVRKPPTVGPPTPSAGPEGPPTRRADPVAREAPPLLTSHV